MKTRFENLNGRKIEAIEIEIEERQRAMVPLSRPDRLAEAIVQQAPIGQIRQSVVLGHIGQFERQCPGRAHVMEHHDGTRDVAAAVVPLNSKIPV
jgi:hypothetical protein